MEKRLAQLGLPAILVAVLYPLWERNAYQYVPLVIALSAWITVYLFKLHHRLPVVQGYYAELEALNLDKPQQVSARLKNCIQTIHTQLGVPRIWSRWLSGAERAFNAALGPKIWTYQAFNRLLVVAYVYPLLLLLGMWLLFDQGTLGQAQVLPLYGTGHFGKRVLAVLLILIPGVLMMRSFRPFRGGSMSRNETKSRTRFLLGSSFSMGLFVLSLHLLEAYFNFSVIAFAAVVAFVGAGAFAFADAGEGASAGKGAGTVAGAVALAGTGTGAITGSVSFVVAGVIAGTVAVLIVIIVERTRKEFLKVALVTTTLLMVGALVVILTPMRVAIDQLAADKAAFLLLVFFCVLPVCNALFDWVSVSVTRFFLLRYGQRSRNGASLIAADVVMAVVLTVGLYAAVLGLFWLMQRYGWGIDAQALIRRFRDNPFDPQVSWIAAMAVTNLLPTLYHLVLCVLGWFTRGITFPRADIQSSVASLAQALGLMPLQASPILASNGQPMTTAPKPRQPLSKPVLDGMFNFFYVDHWMALLMVFALICAAWEPYLWLLAKCLAVFV